ncbi:RNA chaperone Hfq [Paraburkholderia sp. MM5477-R1]|uniref:RNA chaperone Hfq n=1 Tax=Paraburkholderia sp. MM5477-R1 TaxID=2991062 RepID=UPI003D1A6F0C
METSINFRCLRNMFMLTANRRSEGGREEAADWPVADPAGNPARSVRRLTHPAVRARYDSESASPTLGKSMSNHASVQDDFLQALASGKTLSSIYMVNGIRLTGLVETSDRLVVVLVPPTGRQIVFKHAISTVMPGVPERSSRSPVRPGAGR